MIKTFVKKPVEIQAVQWTGDNDEEIKDFVGKECDIIRVRTPGVEPDLIIHTLEGDHHALVGDWIIRGVKGEFYPCKPDIFEQTYEEIGAIDAADLDKVMSIGNPNLISTEDFRDYSGLLD